MAKTLKALKDLVPDEHNANKGTERGRGLLEKSLRTYGAGRSILADKDGKVIAGNKTLEVAADVGIPIKVVTTDGHELVVVQRTDLSIDSKAGRELAIADNRVGEINLQWDAALLAEQKLAGAAVGDFFYDSELDLLQNVQSDVKAAMTGGDPNWDSQVFAAPTDAETQRILDKDAQDATVCPMCKRPFGPDDKKAN